MTSTNTNLKRIAIKYMENITKLILPIHRIVWHSDQFHKSLKTITKFAFLTFLAVFEYIYSSFIGLSNLVGK